MNRRSLTSDRIDMLLVLRFTPDVLDLVGIDGGGLETLSPVLGVPFRTRTSHFTAVAVVVPLVPFPAGRPPRRVLVPAGRSSALVLPQTFVGRSGRQGCEAGGGRHVSRGGGLCHVGRVEEPLLGWSAARREFFYGGRAGAGRDLAYGLREEYPLDFDRFDAGRQVTLLCGGGDGLL